MSWVEKVRDLTKKLTSKNDVDIIKTLNILALDFDKRWNYIEKNKNMIQVGSRLEKTIFNIIISYEQDIDQVIDEVNNAILKIVNKHKVEHIQFMAISALGYIKGKTAFKHLMKMYTTKSMKEIKHMRVELAIGLIDKMAAFASGKDKSKEQFDYLTKSIKSKNWLLDLHYTICSYALKLYNESKSEEMVKLLELAIELSPRFERAHHLLGQEYNIKEEWTKAIPYLEKAYSLYENKDDEAINNSLGIAYMRTKQGEKAVKHFKKIIEIKPEFYLYWFNLGYSYLQVKDLENAEKCLRKSYKLNNDYEAARDLLNLIIGVKKALEQNLDDEYALNSLNMMSQIH